MALATSPTFSLTPAPTQQVLSSNYISTFDFTDTELPDTYKENFEIYGNRTIASFLRAASAELPCTSDLIKWTEEGRLHTLYTGATKSGNDVTVNSHNFRVRQTVIISDGSVIEKGIISAVSTNTFTVLSLENADLTAVADSGLSVYVYGSEFAKGTNGMSGALEAVPSFHETNPIIIKDKYAVSGSDMTQIGWVEVSTEGGGSGYLWYLKSEHETRLRYDDYLEMSMVEGVPAEAGSAAASTANGTKGLFYEINQRGNIFNGVMEAKADFDSVLKRLDKQGSILENMFFADRDQNLAIDDFLATQNSMGAGGTSYGAFNNSEKMALNLGFYGFHRGSYEFYKTDWKYLNDASTRGSIEGTGKIRAVVVPSGTKTVYDQILGKKIRQPFLHVKYRKSATEDRKYKTWLTGSAGGASNSDLDAMEVHFLSERALVVIGANNFVLVQD
tara:strand:- start:5018 stop:6355 length:1338 start_codon:yes stop_codon:yes gene_type:complete